MNKKTFKHLYNLAKEGGFTYNIREQKLEEAGYVVSERKDKETIISAEAFNVESLINFYNENEEVLREGTNVLGGWYVESEGNFYLDISAVYYDLEEAKERGRKAEQKAVFNLYNGEEIFL